MTEIYLTRRQKQEIRALERRKNYIPEWLKEKKIKKCKTGEHSFVWNFDNSFEDSRILEIDCLGIPVICSKCKTKGIEWWAYSCIKDANGKIID